MNLSTAVTDIKNELGLQTIALPFKEPVENVIRDYMQRSIRTWSRLKPCLKDGYQIRKNLRPAGPDGALLGVYYIPEFLLTTKVSYADAYLAEAYVTDGNKSNLNTFTVGSPFVGFGSYYPQDIINAQMTGTAISKYISETSRMPTSEWLGYNKVMLHDFPDNCRIRFVVKCEHELNGESIPESQVESFMKLAKLDVQVSLYNTIKNMTGLGSGFKEIQMKIEEWSGCSDKLDQLLEKWEGRFHLDDHDLIQFF